MIQSKFLPKVILKRYYIELKINYKNSLTILSASNLYFFTSIYIALSQSINHSFFLNSKYIYCFKLKVFCNKCNHNKI